MNMKIILALFDVLLSVLGAFGFIFVKRRKFYRRNVAGVEEFSSYSSMVAKNMLEFIIQFASFVALASSIVMFVYLVCWEGQGRF